MDCSVEGEYEFAGIGHIVAIKAANSKLDIEVTNGLTNEVWQSQYDASFIENMTKKTGNFKQFPVFVNMLRSAILKTTDSVWLDLLSFADLEKLRAKKNGIDVTSMQNQQGGSANSNKRYLILMYNVEFDRIHFPLPLNPVSSAAASDAAHVHAVVVRELQTEIRTLRNQLNSDYRIIGYEELKRNYERVVEEKQVLEDAFRQLQEECQLLTHDNGSAKQVRMLKNVIRQLEQDILELKAASQHALAKKDKDFKAISEECEDLRSSERVLKSRVRSLSQELQTFKKYQASRNNSIASDYEMNLNRSGLAKPSPKSRLYQGSLSAREYSASKPVNTGVLYSTRNRSQSRDSLRHTSRSPSASRVPTRLPPQKVRQELQLSAKSQRSAKSAEVRVPLPSNRLTSRSPSPSSRLVGPSVSQRLSNPASGSKRGLIGRGVRTPSVSSIASNNSDLSIAFGNISINANEPKNYLRRAPVAKAVAAGIRQTSRENSGHIPRRDMPMMRQNSRRNPNFDDTENFMGDDDDFSLQKATSRHPSERPLVDSQTGNTRAAEMLEIDARLKRLHNLLKESGDFSN